MAQGEVALVTFVDEYVGPAAASALAADGFTVFCHSLGFTSHDARMRFEADNPACIAATSTDPVAAVAEALNRCGRLDAAFSNDVPMELVAGAIHKSDRADFAKMVEVLLVRPYRVVAAVLDYMVPAKSGRILIATSGAGYRFPHHSSDGNVGYIAARGGANSKARSLAVKHARDNIQINVIAPFYLFSHRVFPSAIGADDPALAAPASKAGGFALIPHGLGKRGASLLLLHAALPHHYRAPAPDGEDNSEVTFGFSHRNLLRHSSLQLLPGEIPAALL